MAATNPRNFRTAFRRSSLQHPAAARAILCFAAYHLEWVVPGGQPHDVFPARSDIYDGAAHALVTAYALKRPDGQWSLLLVNRDQSNDYKVKIAFDSHAGEATSFFTGPVEISIFGKGQYHWHPAITRPVGHSEYPGEPSVVTETSGQADPDGPIEHQKRVVDTTSLYDVPAASIVVVHGSVRDH